MKLAELISNHYENVMPIESLNALRTGNDAKMVFEILSNGFSYRDKEYSLDADSILKAVRDYSEGFVVDIAKRFSSPSNKFEMSQKQAWCVAFAFIKIQEELSY